MAGFREFMPGQVWFYFNGAATKDLERKKELGAITSRPVVILQSAFYPEWNDIITVCPMTSSDRRSGVYIDSTVCKDGSLIEGGTVLPYLFYNVKTKFLFPMIATNHKRKLISLAPEDFEKVREGYLYHLGATTKVPEYVENWKKVEGYDRRIIVRDIRLAINDYEELAHDLHYPEENHDRDRRHRKHHVPFTNPILEQTPPESTTIENHIIASLTEYDRTEQKMYAPNDGFNAACIGEVETEPSGNFVTEKTVKHIHQIQFNVRSVEDFSNILGEMIPGLYPVATETGSQIFPGSTHLESIELKAMPAKLSSMDTLKIINMTISDIVNQTGIGSKSTASRLRKELRERYESVIEMQCSAPEPFRYDKSTVTLNKPRAKRNARRRYFLFKYTKAELLEMAKMNPEDLAKVISKLPGSYAKNFIQDIQLMYPDEFIASEVQNDDSIDEPEIESTEIQSESCAPEKKYALWETLSPTEIREIKLCKKQNMQSVSKNFGITKDKARQLRGAVMQMSGKMPSKRQPIIDPLTIEASCLRIIKGDYQNISSEDLLAFCRTDPSEIATYFNNCKSPNTPAKSNIRTMKMEIRKLIVMD